MKFLAHDSDRYGYLSHNGVALPPEHIASRCGIPLAQYTSLLAELDAFEVPSRTPNGIIYCAELLAQSKSRKANKDRVKKHRTCNASVTPHVMRCTEDEDESEKEVTKTLRKESEGTVSKRIDADLVHEQGGDLFASKRPTLETLLLHGAKIGLPESEVHKFWNHYQSNGWRVGKNPMKSYTHSMAGWKITWQEKYANNRQTNGQRIDRNIGTLNEGVTGKYDGIKCNLGQVAGAADV
jgi:hypothetical protein